VRARRIRRLGALRLGDDPVAIDDPAAAGALLAAGIAGIGIQALLWSKEQISLRARATYLAKVLGDPWPDLSDAALAKDGAAWLAPFLAGRTSLGRLPRRSGSGA